MNNIVPINQARMPAGMKERVQSGTAVNKNFAGGIRDAYPMLSIKGKVFTVRMDGASQVIADPATKLPYNALDVVLLNASEPLAKAYYEKGFVDDVSSFQPPDCWSLDGLRPDKTVADKVSPTCANCPKNEFGSAPSRDGVHAGKGKACQDYKRVAVVMPTQLGQGEGSKPLVFMLKVPATSLKNMKRYADNLDNMGWDQAGCITRLHFDPLEAFPKLVMSFVDGLNDAEYAQARELAESKLVKDMLDAPDFDATATPAEIAPNANAEPRVRQAAPVFVDPTTAGVAPTGQAQAPMQRQQAPQQEAPVHAVQPDVTLIELPTGELYNPVTKEFVPRTAPKVEMPQEDPATVPLPDGRFFNATSRKFVTSMLLGAPEVTDAPPANEPAKRQRASRAKPKEAPATVAAAPETSPQAAAAPVDKPNGNGAAAPTQEAAATTPGVEPAPQVLESLLNSLLPKR